MASSVNQTLSTEKFTWTFERKGRLYAPPSMRLEVWTYKGCFEFNRQTHQYATFTFELSNEAALSEIPLTVTVSKIKNAAGVIGYSFKTDRPDVPLSVSDPSNVRQYRFDGSGDAILWTK